MREERVRQTHKTYASILPSRTVKFLSQMRLLALPPPRAAAAGLLRRLRCRAAALEGAPSCSAQSSPRPTVDPVRLAGLAATSCVAPRLSILESLVLDRFWDAVASAYRWLTQPWLRWRRVRGGGGGAALAHRPALGGAAPRWVCACNAAALRVPDARRLRRQAGAADGSGSRSASSSTTASAWASAGALRRRRLAGLRSAWPWALSSARRRRSTSRTSRSSPPVRWTSTAST